MIYDEIKMKSGNKKFNNNIYIMNIIMAYVKFISIQRVFFRSRYERSD